jgi:hypothetical protein
LRVDDATSDIGQLELGAHAVRDEVEVFAVAGDVALHEGAERQDCQAVGARFIERRADELGGKALALEARGDACA